MRWAVRSRTARPRPTVSRSRSVLWGVILLASLTATVSAGVLAGCREGPDKLILGLVLPPDSAGAGGLPGDPAETLSEALYRELGIKVEVFPFSSPAELTQALAAGQVDIAVTSPYAYVAARAAGGAQVIFKCVTNGRAVTLSQIVTLASGGPASLNELKGRGVAFIDPASPLGYLFPAAFLVENGIIPSQDLAEVLFLGDGTSVLKAVLEGRAQAGACPEGTIDQVEAEIPGARERLSVLATTPPVPGPTVSVRAGLKPDLVDRVKRALLAVAGSGGQRPVWEALTGTQGLVEAQDPEYDVIRDMVNALGIDIEVLAAS